MMGRPRKVRPNNEETVQEQQEVNQVAPVIKRERPTRTPYSGRRDILTVKGKEDGFVYRWTNPENVDYRKEQGWEIVAHSVTIGAQSVNQGGNVGKAVSRRVGNNREDFLMRIPKDWYQEDDSAKQRENDEIDAAIRGKAKESGHYGSFKQEVKRGFRGD